MKKKIALLIKEYNKKTLIAIRTCNQIFFKKIHSLNFIKLLTRCALNN